MQKTQPRGHQRASNPHEDASSLIALVNQRHHTYFQGLEEMHVHLQNKAEMAGNKQKKHI